MFRVRISFPLIFLFFLFLVSPLPLNFSPCIPFDIPLLSIHAFLFSFFYSLTGERRFRILLPFIPVRIFSFGIRRNERGTSNERDYAGELPGTRVASAKTIRQVEEEPRRSRVEECQRKTPSSDSVSYN